MLSQETSDHMTTAVDIHADDSAREIGLGLKGRTACLWAMMPIPVLVLILYLASDMVPSTSWSGVMWWALGFIGLHAMLLTGKATVSAAQKPSMKSRESDRRVETKPSFTAILCASVRNGLHISGLVHDPYSRYFLDWRMRLTSWLLAANYKLRGDLLKGEFVTLLGRTLFFDEAVRRFLKTHPSANYVALAAGCDSRSLRITPKTVTCIEVDIPTTQSYKKDALKCSVPAEDLARITFLGVDFARQSWLEELQKRSPFDPSKPTIITIEGVLSYLPAEAVDQCLRSVATLHGATVVLNINDSALRQTDDQRNLKKIGEPHIFGIAPGAETSWLASYGIEVIRCISGPHEILNYLSDQSIQLKFRPGWHTRFLECKVQM